MRAHRGGRRLARLARVTRIQEHAAPRHDAVHFRDHRRHPAHVEVLAARAVGAGEALVDEIAHRLFPVAMVGSVDGVFGGVGRHLHALADQPVEFRTYADVMKHARD